ncbi:DUF5995 family protein [Rhodococcus sp. FXJ9.536]|uniref:DUF5995 family protein n=1 Tax=Rhodococcus tibetensis TaxID=2965064 RepID=A0ABT1Q8R3_9NOCA|nr:DUF5995 family protein [Rhodococcus sp. FXJ9.536]MCQ4118631.1 DUF5995 family protein [Rhodococcus sp. FXJ9.536]
MIVSTTALPTLVSAQPAGAVSTACGEALTQPEVARIVALSDLSTLPDTLSLGRLEDEVARHAEITAVLVRHHDRRGLFSLGLDAVEHSAVMPLQRDPTAFADRHWAHAISSDLLRRYLRNLHAEFTGAAVEPQWERYFSLSKQCSLSPARVAMVGYNAHITMDLARAVASSGTSTDDIPGYYKIVDSIARDGDTIVADTKDVYGADLGPLWRFYFVGEGLDRLAGSDVPSDLLLRAADSGYNTLTLANGFALQSPDSAPAAESEMAALVQANDAALGVLSDLGGL